MKILQTYVIGSLAINSVFTSVKIKLGPSFSLLNVRSKSFRIKQHSRVTCLGCILEETMSGESMAHKVINKVNARLKFYIGKINI